jgi:hypothetical protein
VLRIHASIIFCASLMVICSADILICFQLFIILNALGVQRSALSLVPGIY